MGISLKSLSFTYRGNQKPAIKNITTEIEDGKFIVIMGHEGA